MARPFGWLIVAEPTDQLDIETAELRSQLNVVRRFDEERSRFDADRMARRLAELDAFREAGLWNVRVLVGAADVEQLNVIAPMLVGAADLTSHPYRLRGPDRAMDLADALAATASYPADQAAVPFSATAGVLAALAGLPRREVPGMRILDVGYFDVTAEQPGDDWITLGTILDGKDRGVGAFGVPLSTLNRHALVTGATGSGKSQTVQAPARPAHQGQDPVAGDRAGQVRVRLDRRPDRRFRRRADAHQPSRPWSRAARGQPARARTRLPGPGPHRHGQGAVPGRVRRQGTVPADHVAGAAAGLRVLRLGPGERLAASPVPSYPPPSRRWPSFRPPPSR